MVDGKLAAVEKAADVWGKENGKVEARDVEGEIEGEKVEGDSVARECTE